MTRLLMLEGDGIGPELIAGTKSVLAAASTRFGLGLKFEHATIGFDALAQSGVTIPPEVIAKARGVDGLVLGPVSHNAYPPVFEGGLNPSGVLRKSLDLYANIRPARTFAGYPSPCRIDFDLIIFRENTEGFYADRNMATGSGEVSPDEDMVLALRKVTRKASRRIAQAAFECAAARPARHVTAVHKANVLRASDGLFLEEVRRIAALYPDVTYDEVLVDSMAALLVRKPQIYDVIVTTNMFGDILSDLAAELSGSLGLAASLNAGSHHAMAQAQHGSAPDLAGKDLANPASLILSAAMLLTWLGTRGKGVSFHHAAEAIEQAVEACLRDPKLRTADLGGVAGTKAMSAAIARAVAIG
ncbi:MAG TPA: 3-isopropylmalate dehydrogenase [Rhodobacter sp.]|nr:3-isopropylmalate dehydrogenase [Rhodobacter sp.]